MAANTTFLFVSIDGMTDPLGQSQVLPYLIGLSQKGYKIGIVSCEKRTNWSINHSVVESILKKAGISWTFSFYHAGLPFISQYRNFCALKQQVSKMLAFQNERTILHCRSYLPGLIGLHFKQKFKIRFIFDMRGFWADERIEGGIWKKSNPIGALLYAYFKNKEKAMLREADSIVSLTKKAKDIILDWQLGIAVSKIHVIPCCADLKHFSNSSLDSGKLNHLKNSLPQLSGKFVLCYVGSLGTWYMADEMLQFFQVLTNKVNAVFLCITKDDPHLVLDAASKQEIPLEKITVVSASRDEMPSYIALSSASIFFIKPSFSKSASSPTKMGELLSMGIPVVTNSGVGDVDDIVTKSQCGILVRGFNENDYRIVADELVENINLYQKNTVSTAHQFFSLNEGIDRYSKIYNSFN
ncbi:MAG: glycosyltransferase [Bacteroidota bacterium]|jgi:glycosyltransferase involved in cell wall biosynthesis|nr:glycosyltransferase [Bacteroidota bacterium]